MITIKVKKISFFLATSLFLNSLGFFFILHFTGISQIKEIQRDLKSFEKNFQSNSQQIKTVQKELKELKTNYDKLQVLDIHTAIQQLWIRVFNGELDQLQPLCQAIQQVYHLCQNDIGDNLDSKIP